MSHKQSATNSLVNTWLTLDFFADSRTSGQPGSSLTTTIFTQSFFGLVFAALVMPEPPYENVTAYLAANLSLSTLMVGIGVLGDPQRYKRALADEVLVWTSPLRPSTLTLARALHGLFYVALVTIGMALPPAILAWWVCGSAWVIPVYLLLAVVCTGIMAGTLGVITRGVRAIAGPARSQLVAGSLKAVLLGGGFVMFVLGLRHLEDTAADLPLGPWSALAWPPYWAARVLASPDQSLAFGLALGGTALLLYVAGTLLQRPDLRRHKNRTRRGGLGPRLDKMLASPGPTLGTTRFISTMLYRSPGYRARVLPLFGLPLAMVLLSFWGQEDERSRRLLLGITLQFPAIFMPFLVAFLPRSDQEHTRWLFDTCPSLTPALFRRSSLIAMSTHVLLPVHAIALLLALALAGWQATQLLFVLGLSLFSFGLAILALVLVLRRLDQMPFTIDEAQAEGESPLDFGHLLGVALILVLAGGAFATALHSLAALLVGTAVAVLGLQTLRRARFAAG